MACVLDVAGMDLDVAPCVDVDVEPAWRVIGAVERSFSGDAGEVSACAARVVRAHRESCVGCVLKHFPGHGSAPADSHHDLVDISTSWERERELAPYRSLIGARVGVMTGHLMLTAFDSDQPASLSRALTTGLLRDELGFFGPVFTDALDMEGVRARWSLGDAIRLGVSAGADVLLHACNSSRREYAPDVVRVMEEVCSGVEGLTACAALSRERVRYLV